VGVFSSLTPTHYSNLFFFGVAGGRGVGGVGGGWGFLFFFFGFFVGWFVFFFVFFSVFFFFVFFLCKKNTQQKNTRLSL